MLGLHRNHTVIKRLKWKRELGTQAEHIRPLLLIMSGNMRGVYGGGAALALLETGMFELFDTVVGISTGAAIAAYSLAGIRQAEIGATVYLEECVGGPPMNYPFIAPWRLTNPVDTEFIEFVFSFGWKRIDVDAIRRSPQDFYVGATNIDTMQLDLINAKTAQPTMLRAVRASMATAGSEPDPISVNGHRYLDGWFNPLPLELIVKQLRPTDIVVIPNCTEEHFRRRTKIGPTHLALASLALRYGSRRIIKGVLDQPKRIHEALDWLSAYRGVNVGFLWAPDAGISQLTTDPKKLKSAMELAKREALKIFG